MKAIISVLFLFIMVLSSCNVNQEKSKNAARQKELASGVIVDSILLGFKFGDSPEEVNNKIQSYINKNFSCNYRFTYPKILSKYCWHFNLPSCSFYNDSLYELTLEADIYSYDQKECLVALDSLFSTKYGTSYTSDNEKNWFKGNLNIRIGCINSDYTHLMFISYFDERHYQHNSIYKKLDGYIDDTKFGFSYYYSKEYWDKTWERPTKIVNDYLKEKAIEDI